LCAPARQHTSIRQTGEQQWRHATPPHQPPPADRPPTPLNPQPSHPPQKHPNSYKLNIWDVGGQKTLRPYWRNYYEKTDGLIWVVDSADLARLEDCRAELAGLLTEERLFGATLLILANKQDIPSALSLQQIEEVRAAIGGCALASILCVLYGPLAAAAR
jgi:GTPase SAR1 family protein